MDDGQQLTTDILRSILKNSSQLPPEDGVITMLIKLETVVTSLGARVAALEGQKAVDVEKALPVVEEDSHAKD